ncbi:MFS transporter [Dactylosporangium sp. NPDC051541]|uniref:MFS transporter n=1 Tax=Dactylosporangium sp. NPDC051541 TaxID=3363977 RepID=UPI0037B827A9
MLWNRDFSLYCSARTVSLLGDAMLPVAAALAVGGVYGVAGVGYVLAIWTGPFVLLIVFGGVFSDRVGARTMMIGSDAVRTVTQGVVAIAFFTGTPPLWLLLVCSALSGTAAAMFQPGVNGMVPLVATDPQRANGVLKIADAVTQLGGPVLAGVLVVAAGAGPVYAVDAGTFLISGVCLALIRPAPATTARAAATLLRDLRRGWTEFRARTWMWSVILLWMGFGLCAFGPYIPLASQLISARLGAEAYGWTIAALGTGTMLGGFVAIRFRAEHPLAAGAVALIGFVAVPLTVALAAPLPILIAGHITGGAAIAFWSVQWATSVQTLVPADVLNRVTAYEVAGSVSGIAAGQALAGPVTAVIAPRDVLLAAAAVTVAVIAALLIIRPTRTLRRRQDGPAAQPSMAVR